MPRAERERLILEVAGGVFARGGYHAASMEEIAELADVSKPMLYAYFGSKEGLYVAYIDKMGRQLLDRLVAAGRQGEPAVARLRSRIVEFLAFVQENRDGWKVLFSEMNAGGPVAAEVAQLRGQIADAVRRMIESDDALKGTVRAPASNALAHAIVGAGESLANWWLQERGVSRDLVADWYVGIVRAAVGSASH
jgi:AcrR family transcriptional regulator